MKTIFNPLSIIIILLLICTSCTKDDDSITNESLNLRIELDDSKSKNTSFRNQVDYLETEMQWASFIIAKTMMNSTHRSFINNHLITHQTEVISLNDLIGDSPISEGIKTSFLDHLEYYAQPLTPDPDHEKDKPGSITPPGNSPLFPLTTQEIIDQYLNAVLIENCIEIYFPNKAPEPNPFVGYYTITSTAHPLTNANSNQGIIRYSVDQPITEFPGWMATNATTVDDAYVSANPLIVVARPYKSFTSACDYNEYSDINFTDFLH